MIFLLFHLQHDLQSRIASLEKELEAERIMVKQLKTEKEELTVSEFYSPVLKIIILKFCSSRFW